MRQRTTIPNVQRREHWLAKRNEMSNFCQECACHSLIGYDLSCCRQLIESHGACHSGCCSDLFLLVPSHLFDWSNQIDPRKSADSVSYTHLRAHETDSY